MLIKIDRQIDHMEEQKRRLKVQELSFNSYYEFALERIPQITQLEKIYGSNYGCGWQVCYQ